MQQCRHPDRINPAKTLTKVNSTRAISGRLNLMELAGGDMLLWRSPADLLSAGGPISQQQSRIEREYKCNNYHNHMICNYYFIHLISG